MNNVTAFFQQLSILEDCCCYNNDFGSVLDEESIQSLANQYGLGSVICKYETINLTPGACHGSACPGVIVTLSNGDSSYFLDYYGEYDY